jgi:glutamyl-tRNA reductase
MRFFAFGINFETSTVEAREAFALSAPALSDFYRGLNRGDGLEVIVLSTCNRTEVYLYGTRSHARSIQQRLAALRGTQWPESSSFFLEDEPAVQHVLHVTSGLKSMVLGDSQILAQVKDAYRLAVEEDAVGTVLHRLMHSAFRAAKRVVSETGLLNGAASVSGAAVAMALDHFERQGTRGLQGRGVLLVGTGQMGKLALHALASQRPSSIAVTNRTEELAVQVASAVGARVVPWGARHEAIAGAHVVIVATGADEPVVFADALEPRRAGAPDTLIIDIAVPRNVDRAVDHLPGYSVLDLDALNEWMRQTDERRRSELPSANAICDEILAEFVSWMFHQQALQPAIQALRETFDRIRRQEIERHHHRFSDADRAQLDQITTSILQKLLAVPVVRLKSVDPDSIDFVRGIRLLETLFSRAGCDDDLPAAPSVSAEAGRRLREILRSDAIRDPDVVPAPDPATLTDAARGPA